METSKKVFTRNSLLCKLTGTNWGANARTLRTNTVILYGRSTQNEGGHCTTQDFSYGNRMYSINTNFRPSTTQGNRSTSYTPKNNITGRAEQTDSRHEPIPSRLSSRKDFI